MIGLHAIGLLLHVWACVDIARRGTCLALRFQTGSWMLFIDSTNSNKIAAVYTVDTSSIRIFNCLYFPDKTLKTY